MAEFDDLLAPYAESQGRGEFPSFLPLPPLRRPAELRNIAPRPGPTFQDEVAANVSPLEAGRGMADILHQTYGAAREGDWSGVADRLPLALGMFAGMKAKTANLPALERAQTMAAKGAPREAIWNDTGWFQGPDKKWRYEIDDSNAALGPSGKGRLSNVLEHEALYQAYPELAKTPTRGLSGLLGLMTGGGYREPRPKWFGLSQDNGEMVYSKAYEGLERLKKLLHESQHGVQWIEDFGRGANTNGLPSLTEAEMGVLQARHQQLAEAERARLLDLAKRWDQNAEMFPNNPKNAATADQYRREAQTAVAPARKFFPDEQSFLRDLSYDVSSGEVEGRNVEKRLPMTSTERRATPPWKTQDVPDALQIVRGSGKRP